MAIFILICIVALGIFAAYRLLAPYMYVPISRPGYHFPWSRPHLLEEPSAHIPVVDHLPPAIDLPLQTEEMSVPAAEKITKVEILLLEKNRLLDRLQKQLEAERSHRAEFEKVKEVMEGEIKRLKDQIKNIKHKEQNHA